jgi:hypothetical protein
VGGGLSGFGDEVGCGFGDEVGWVMGIFYLGGCGGGIGYGVVCSSLLD